MCNVYLPVFIHNCSMSYYNLLCKFELILLCCQYLSICMDPLTYHHWKSIELYQVSFVDDKEVYLVLQLIEKSPNLLELQIYVSNFNILNFLLTPVDMKLNMFVCSSTSLSAKRDPLDFWYRKSHLLISSFVGWKLWRWSVYLVCHFEMNFIEYLQHSPGLETMSMHWGCVCRKMIAIFDMLRFCRRPHERRSFLILIKHEMCYSFT